MARLRSPKRETALDVRATLLEMCRTEAREAERRGRLVVRFDDGTCFANPVAAELARLERGDPVDVAGSTIAAIYWRADRPCPAWLNSSARYRLHPDGAITRVDPAEWTT